MIRAFIRSDSLAWVEVMMRFIWVMAMVVAPSRRPRSHAGDGDREGLVKALPLIVSDITTLGRESLGENSGSVKFILRHFHNPNPDLGHELLHRQPAFGHEFVDVGVLGVF